MSACKQMAKPAFDGEPLLIARDSVKKHAKEGCDMPENLIESVNEVLQLSLVADEFLYGNALDRRHFKTRRSRLLWASESRTHPY